jgi:hypothetical protein
MLYKTERRQKKKYKEKTKSANFLLLCFFWIQEKSIIRINIVSTPAVPNYISLWFL